MKPLLTTLLLLLILLTSGCSLITQKSTTELPADIEENCIGLLIGAPDEAKTVAMFGGAWVRPHPGPFAWDWIEKTKGSFDFSETDDWVKRIQKNNVTLAPTIWPFADWDQAACHSSTCQVTQVDQFYPENKKDKEDISHGIPQSRCAPCDYGAYKNFLGKIVERYDGDGLDDMPGLKIPIKYWEILNEPEMNSDDLIFYKGTPAEYVEILKHSQVAIKSACPDCKIIQGGAAGAGDKTELYWSKIFDLGGAQYFDIANIHFINYGDADTLNVAGFKKLMTDRGINKPIWVTEAQCTSENTVLKSTEGALKAGASKIFFTSPVIGQMGPPTPGQYSKVYDKVKSKCE